MGGFYTTVDLADEVGVATDTVARWIRMGRFPGAFIRGNRWRIPYAEAEDCISHRRDKTRVIVRHDHSRTRPDAGTEQVSIQPSALAIRKK